MARIAVAAGYSVTMIEWDRSAAKARTERIHGITYARLSLKSSFGLKSLLRAPFWLAFATARLASGSCDIVQPRNLDSLLPVVLASTARKFKVVYDMADFYGDAYLTRVPILSGLSRVLERTLVRGADAIILASPGQVGQVGQPNLPDALMVFYNVPFTEPQQGIAPVQARRPNSGTLELLYVGALAFDRTPLLLNLIDAARNLPVRLSIGGFGERESEIASLPLGNNQVVFLGKLDHWKVMELTDRTDIVVLPYDFRSYNDKIGMPNKLFEALSMGKPILAPRGTMMGELVEDADAGFLADFSDVQSLRASVLAILQYSADELQAMGQRGKLLFQRRFNADRLTEEYLELLTGVLSQPQRSQMEK